MTEKTNFLLMTTLAVSLVLLSPSIVPAGTSDVPASVVRQSLGTRTCGEKFTIKLDITQPSGSAPAVGIEERTPAGWVVTASPQSSAPSGGGQIVSGGVNWFFFNQPAVTFVTYEVQVPLQTSGNFQFGGTYRVASMSVPQTGGAIGGAQTVSVTCAGLPPPPPTTPSTSAPSTSAPTTAPSSSAPSSSSTTPTSGGSSPSAQVVRADLGSRTCGVKFQVSLSVSWHAPAAQSPIITIEEQVPPGWNPEPDAKGSLGPDGVLRWPLFFDTSTTLVSYFVTPTSGASGSFSFAGTYRTDTMPDHEPDRAVGGDTSVGVSCASTSTSSSPTQTTSNGPPSVNMITPVQGPAAGGTSVTILGANFLGATSVSFGPKAAVSFTVLSAGQISAVAPAQAPGFVDVRVGSPRGLSAATGTADDFRYLPTTSSSAAPTTTSAATTSAPPPPTTSSTATTSSTSSAAPTPTTSSAMPPTASTSSPAATTATISSTPTTSTAPTTTTSTPTTTTASPPTTSTTSSPTPSATLPPGTQVVRSDLGLRVCNIPFTVTLQLDWSNPPTTMLAFEERVPAGWKVVGTPSNAGDATTPGSVKWFFVNLKSVTSVTYSVKPAANAFGSYEFLGTYRTSAPAQFATPTGGDRSVDVACAGATPSPSPTNSPPPTTTTPTPTTSTPPAANQGSVSRSIVGACTGPVTVTLTVTPPAGTTAWLLDEVPPIGLAISALGPANGGIHNPTTGRITWVSIDGAAAVLTYQATVPIGTAGGTSLAFAGDYRFEPTMATRATTQGTSIFQTQCSGPSARHAFDANNDCVLGDSELFALISSWRSAASGNLDNALFSGIAAWRLSPATYCVP